MSVSQTVVFHASQVSPKKHELFGRGIVGSEVKPHSSLYFSRKKSLFFKKKITSCSKPFSFRPARTCERPHDWTFREEANPPDSAKKVKCE